MRIPAVVLPTFAHAPFARAVSFHRKHELNWKREVELVLTDPRLLHRTPAPSLDFLRSVFDILPDGWIGSVWFTWGEATHQWDARIIVRDEDIAPVCGFWDRPVVSEAPPMVS